MVVSKQTARNFLLSKQLLLTPRRLKGQAGIETVFNTLKAIQYDPQNPCGRNVDLVLQARVSGVHPNDYHHWLYRQRKGIECYDKELCLVPIEDLPLCRKMRSKTKRYKKLDTFIKQNKQALAELIEKINTDGPLCSSDIRDARKVNIFWEMAPWGRVALESLWKVGKLVICKREKGRKYYDLPHKIYQDKFIWEDEAPLKAEQLIRRLNSVGMLPKSGVGSGWLGLGTGRQLLSVALNLLKKGALKEIQVAGVKRTYVINSTDQKLLEKAEFTKTEEKKISFLPPLDNLLWDRILLRELFDFDYKWEAYTPRKKRKYGHYVLPILYGDRFIGRIEPILQSDGVLEIRGFWLEPNYKWDSATSHAFRSYFTQFKRYLKVEKA